MKDKIQQIFNNKIFRAGSMSLMATVLTRAINLISVPIFSRLLTAAEYGQMDVFFTYVNIFFVILGLDFNGALGKGKLDFEKESNEFVTSSILFTVISSVIIVSVINVFYNILQPVFGLDKQLVNIMFLYSYAMFIMNYRIGEYNFDFSYKKGMIISVCVATFNLAISIVLVETLFKNNHVLGRVLGATIPTVICAIIVFVYYGKRGNWKIRKKHVLYSLKFGVPLIPHNLSHMILSSSDKIMINNVISSRASGIYSLSYTLGMMIQVASEAMNQVFSPWEMRKLQNRQDDEVRVAQRPYLLLYSMITVCVMTISPEIIGIMANEEYWEGKKFVMWIVFATFLNFTYTLYVNIEFFHKKTGLISMGTMLAATINVILNSLFLPKYGYIFAVASTVLSYVLLLLFHMIIVNFVLKMKIVDNFFVFIMVGLVLLVTVLMCVCADKILIRVMIGMLSNLLLISILFKMKKRGLKIDF